MYLSEKQKFFQILKTKHPPPKTVYPNVISIQCCRSNRLQPFICPVDSVRYGVHSHTARPAQTGVHQCSPLWPIHPGTLYLHYITNLCPEHQPGREIRDSEWWSYIFLNRNSLECEIKSGWPFLWQQCQRTRLIQVFVQDDAVVQWLHSGCGQADGNNLTVHTIDPVQVPPKPVHSHRISPDTWEQRASRVFR